jgi:CheY-like chemotaxis protein
MKTRKRRILLVDDDARLSRVLKLGLEASGYEVRSENESPRALQVVREFLPDLIVLDINMPGMDGGDVAQELRAQKDVGQTPFIFLTSLLCKQDPARPKALAETILSKPVSIVELKKCIEERLGPE